ncbi:MAG TPA: hypothetical protein VLB84_03505, partial [Bacteroidia bacterium]|nr:hypothetical protein [Bacteroidia bacterium]
GASDSVYFDAGGTGQCILNATVNVKLFKIASGYTDTIKQTSVAITATEMNLNDGTFTGGTNNITVNGPFILSGCSYKSTSAMLTIKGNYLYSSGSFFHNNGYVKLYGSGNISISGNTNFFDLDFYGSFVTYTLDTSTILTVENTLILSSSNGGLISGQISAKGNIQENCLSANPGAHTTIIELNGTGNQYIFGHTNPTYSMLGWMPDMRVNKTSGIVYLNGYVTIRRIWEVIQGEVDAVTYNSTLCFPVGTTGGGWGGSIKGKKNQQFNNILISTYGSYQHTFTVTDSIIVLGAFTTSGVGSILIEGYIHARGNVSLVNTGTAGGGNGTLFIDGSSKQVLEGNSLVNTGKLCNVRIDKSSSDTLILKNIVSVNGNWKYVRGIVDASSYASTIVFCKGTRTISGNHSLYKVIFVPNGANSDNTIPATDTLTITRELKLENGNYVKINTGTINVLGDIITNNAMSGTNINTGSIYICGSSDQIFTGNAATGVGGLCNIKINKPGGTLYLNGNITIGPYSWKYIKGTVNAGTSTVAYFGSGTVDCGTATSSMSFNNFIVQFGDVNMAGLLNVKSNLTINQARTLNSNGYDVNVGGNFTGSGLFYSGTGAVIFNGTGLQAANINADLSNVKVNKPSGKLYSGNLKIWGSLALIKGIVVSLSNTALRLQDNATLTGGSNASYVTGPFTKLGDDAFTFPLGDTTITDTAACYHPFSMTAPSTTTSSYTAQYYAKNPLADHPTFTPVASTLNSISNCEYWSLTRNVGTAVITPSLGWNINSCNINELSDLRVASWNGSEWQDLSQSTTTGNLAAGTVKASVSGPNTGSQFYTIAETIQTPLANQRYWIGNGSNKSWNNT